MARLYPQYLRPNLTLLYVFFGILGLAFVVSIVKCRTHPFIHSFLLKLVSGMVYFLLILSAFVNTTVIIAVILVTYMLGFIEVILTHLIYGKVDTDTPTIFKLRGKK